MTCTFHRFPRAIGAVLVLALFCGTATAQIKQLKPKLTRGPYVQRAAEHHATIRWRTNKETKGRIWLGVAPGAYIGGVDGPLTKDHEIRITGLLPGKRYYYAVGYGSTVLGGGNSDYFVETPPPVGSSKPLRIWALGDSGTADANAEAVRDAYYAYTGDKHTDLWLMLGDNAYTVGSDAEYQKAVFDMYPEMLRKSPLFATLGNHEAYVSTYFDIFTLPSAGEAGGVPSGSEAYYSFNYGNVHFVSLDSASTSVLVGDAMHTWLKADLAANDQDWTIAFWHHPPYSKGSHDSDVDWELTSMRQNFVPLLEDYGVDLVLSGHSHSYERSYLIDGHHGSSSTFHESMKKDPGDGQPGSDGAYHKAPIPHAGAIFCVAGSSGKIHTAPLDHPAMIYGAAELGSLVIDVDDHRMDVRFLRETGVVADHFTIMTYPDEGLTSKRTTISISAAGTQILELDAGPAFAGKDYALLGSMTGTTPGMPLASVVLPLVPDAYTEFTLQGGPVLPGSKGVLDGAGEAYAAIPILPSLPASLAGLTIYHAYLVWDFSDPGLLVFTSNAFPLTLVP